MFFSVVEAVVVYVMGQIIQRFILKPFQDFRAVLGKISYNLKFFANLITNPVADDKLELVTKTLRSLACRLESRYFQLFWGLSFCCWNFPNKKNIKNAVDGLIRLSNSAGNRDYLLKNSDEIEKIKDELHLN